MAHEEKMCPHSHTHTHTFTQEHTAHASLDLGVKPGARRERKEGRTTMSSIRHSSRPLELRWGGSVHWGWNWLGSGPQNCAFEKKERINEMLCYFYYYYFIIIHIMSRVMQWTTLNKLTSLGWEVPFIACFFRIWLLLNVNPPIMMITCKNITKERKKKGLITSCQSVQLFW